MKPCDSWKKKSIPRLSTMILESKINSTVGQWHISSSKVCICRGWTEVYARPVCSSEFVHNYTTFQTKQIADIAFPFFGYLKLKLMSNTHTPHILSVGYMCVCVCVRTRVCVCLPEALWVGEPGSAGTHSCFMGLFQEELLNLFMFMCVCVRVCVCVRTSALMYKAGCWSSLAGTLIIYSSALTLHSSGLGATTTYLQHLSYQKTGSDVSLSSLTQHSDLTLHILRNWSSS